jgi:hypothetical protein
MKHLKGISMILFALFLYLSASAVSTSAQTRRFVYRPYVARSYGWYDPFWSGNRWWNSGFYDPYWSDPYMSEQREKYYKEKDVRDARNKLAKDRAKYRSDGVLTAEEQEKLAKRAHDYNKAVQKLNKFYREG